MIANIDIWDVCQIGIERNISMFAICAICESLDFGSDRYSGEVEMFVRTCYEFPLAHNSYIESVIAKRTERQENRPYNFGYEPNAILDRVKRGHYFKPERDYPAHGLYKMETNAVLSICESSITDNDMPVLSVTLEGSVLIVKYYAPIVDSTGYEHTRHTYLLKVNEHNLQVISRLDIERR